jgi:hypothetical protein
MARRFLPMFLLLLAAGSARAELSKNASCVGCHPAIAAEWAKSLHKHAWKDPVFQKAYEVEPMAFCRGCHAPTSDPAKEPTKLAQDIGVGCVTCHVQGGHVVGPRPAPASTLHPVLADATMATQKQCASCHQFDFPKSAHQVSPEAMQDTLREHASSTMKDKPCQSCHMPMVDGPDGKHRSHTFSVIADPAMLRRAVNVMAERTGAGRAQLILTAGEVGHAFPTGDMFRRLEVRAEAIDAAGKILARAEPTQLARTFIDVPRDPNGKELTFMRVEAADTRVPAPGMGSRTVELEVEKAPPGARLRWRVVYQRMSTPMADAFSVSQVLDEVVVAEGVLPPVQLVLNHGGRR